MYVFQNTHASDTKKKGAAFVGSGFYHSFLTGKIRSR